MQPTNTAPAGTRNAHRLEDAVVLGAGVKTRLPLESSGLFREDRTIELFWLSTVPGSPGGLLVQVIETGERGQDVAYSFNLADGQAHRFPVVAGLRIDVTGEVAGSLSFRTLNAGPKRAPPVNTAPVVLPPLGVWTDVGPCPPFRTDLCVFREDAAFVQAGFFTFAGVFVAFCPFDNVVIHPPMLMLRGRNNAAAAQNRIIAVWR